MKKYDSLELVCSSDITNILNEYGINKATVVVWMVHGIFWGELSDNKISLLDMENINFKLCQEIRIFNINFELHLRIISNKAVGRLVIDYDKMIDKENIYLSEYVDTVSRFWGENITDDDADKLILHDFSRKLTLKLPVSQLECSNAKFSGLQLGKDYKFKLYVKNSEGSSSAECTGNIGIPCAKIYQETDHSWHNAIAYIYQETDHRWHKAVPLIYNETKHEWHRTATQAESPKQG